MACRKAFELDLVACLLDAERPEWSEFREHYPRCAECAAEVRTWTELQSRLEPAHPAVEDLIRFESRANDLAPHARSALAAHIATCRSCRDELAALRAFDPRALAPPAAPEPPQIRRRRGIARVVLHPAFAYGVALAVAVPALFPAIGRRVTFEVTAMWRRTHAGEPPSAVAKAPAKRADTPAGHAPAAPPTAHPDAAASAPHGAGEPPARVAARDATQPAANLPAGRQSAPNDGWPVVVLTPARELAVPAPTGGLVVRLAPPRSQPAVPPGLAWLRVRDAAGRRELREQQFGTPGSSAEIRIPAGWLEPGGYRADIVLGDGARPIVVARFRIEP